MSPHRIAAWTATVVAVAAVAAGLYLSGSPAEQRLLRLDERRVADLDRLSLALRRHVVDTGALPERLDELLDGRRLTRMPRDPVSDEPYEYVVTAPLSFELCARFSRVSPRPSDDFWSHDAGRSCYRFDYSDQRVPMRVPPPAAR